MIIDSLLVKLKLNISEFVAGKTKVDKDLKATGNEADKTANKLKKLGKDGAAGFENIAKSATKFLAIIGGTMFIKSFVEQTIVSSAALDRFSKNLGSNVATVSAWGKAAEVAGGSASGLRNTMSMLSRAQTQLMLTGESELIPYFSALGLSMTDAYGKALPLDKLILETGQALLAKTPDRKTAFNMGQTMGIDAGTLNMILRSRKEVELLLKQQAQHAAAMSKFAPDASKLNRMMVEGRQAFELFGLELLQRAVPAIEKMFSIFADFTSWVKENQEFVSTYLTIIAVGFGAIAAATIPINLAVVTVLAFAAAIATLYQDYQTFKNGGESLIDWAKWEPGITEATMGLKFLRDLLIDMLLRAVGLADAILSLAKGDFSGAKLAAGVAMTGIPGVGLQSIPSSEEAKPTTQNTDRAKFIATASAKLGVPEAVIDAHLRSETGVTGKSTIGDFNYGNIKAGKSWGGSIKNKNVLEYDESGRPRTENAAFRSYESPEDAGANYAELLSKRYPGTQGAGNAESFAKALKSGGYATDPNYVSKITKIAGGIHGASQAAAGAGAGQGAQSALTGNRSVETNIGEIKIYSAATDANGIARDMDKSLEYLFTAQANSGLN